MPINHSIKKSLFYVRGAIDATQFVPVLKTFAINDKRVQGSDGIITLNAPIDLQLNLCIDAKQFVRAISACASTDKDIDLTLTQANNLRIAQGRFRAIVKTIPDTSTYPWATADGVAYSIPDPDDFLTTLTTLSRFISTDATRPWSMGVLISKGYAYATNNIVLVRKKLPKWHDIDDVIIPSRAIDELKRLAIPPKFMLLAEQSIVFMHARAWWMKTQRLNGAWPDVARMIDNRRKTSKLIAIRDDLSASLETLQPFLSNNSAIYMMGGCLRTSPFDTDETALIEGFDATTFAISADAFKLLLSVATVMHASNDPTDPIYFEGDNMQGMSARLTIPTAPIAAVSKRVKHTWK